MRKMKIATSNEINRVISLSMGGDQEAIKTLQEFLKHPNPDIEVRATDRLDRARKTEETRIDNGLHKMGNISGFEGEILLIRKVAQRTAFTLDEKTVVKNFLDARNGRIKEEADRRIRFEEKVARSKEDAPEQVIRWSATAFRGPTIRKKMEDALKQCGINTIENKLLPEALANNFSHRMDERTQSEVVSWLTKETQKRKNKTARKDEGLVTKIKSRLRGT